VGDVAEDHRTKLLRQRADLAWSTECNQYVVTWYEALARSVPLTSDEEARLETARTRANADELPPPARQPGESDQDWLRRRLAIMLGERASYQTSITETEEGRANELRARYEAYLRYKSVYAPLEAELKQLEQRLRDRDITAIDDALNLLEVKPKYSYSGYRQTRVLRYLKHFELTREQRERVLRVLLDAIDHGGPANGPEGAALARRHSTNAFRRAIRARLYSDDAHVAWHALAMATRVREPGLTAADVARAQEISDRIRAARPWGVPEWLRRANIRFANDRRMKRPGSSRR
jgi:hypothetical protein